jgi:hypothetical protein
MATYQEFYPQLQDLLMEIRKTRKDEDIRITQVSGKEIIHKIFVANSLIRRMC